MLPNGGILFEQMPPYGGIKHREKRGLTMKTTRFEQIDGIRAFAIALVVASHTQAFRLYGQGGLAVAIFFALSGFMLVFPTKEDGEEQFASFKSICLFYIKKIIRLIPTYYIIFLTVHWVTDSSESLLDNLLFRNCYGHLWFLQQEVVFLMIAPYLMLLLYLLKKILKKILKVNNIIIAVLLLISARPIQEFLTSHGFYLMGNGRPQPFRIGLLLIGMAFGYLYKSSRNFRIKSALGKVGADVICLILMFASVFSSAYFLGKINPALEGYQVGWYRPYLCALASGLFFIMILYNSDGFLAKVLQFPIIVYIGKVSYSIYLIHFFIIPYAPFSANKKIFVAVFLASLGISSLLYEWIEKPVQALFTKICERSKLSNT